MQTARAGCPYLSVVLTARGGRKDKACREGWTNVKLLIASAGSQVVAVGSGAARACKRSNSIRALINQIDQSCRRTGNTAQGNDCGDELLHFSTVGGQHKIDLGLEIANCAQCWQLVALRQHLEVLWCWPAAEPGTESPDLPAGNAESAWPGLASCR